MQTIHSIEPTFRVISSFDFSFRGLDADATLRGPSWDYASNALDLIKIGKTTRRTERVHIIEVVGYTFPHLIADMNAMPGRRLATAADTVEVLEVNRHFQSKAPVYALGAYWNARGAKMHLYFDYKQGDGTEGRSSHNMLLGLDAPDCWRNDQIIIEPIYVVVVGKFLRH